MGSTTGGYQFPPKETKEIKDIISHSIPKSETGKSSSEEPTKRNVFISFHNEDEFQVNLLRIQAKRDNTGLEFRDYSVKEPIEQWRKNVRNI